MAFASSATLKLIAARLQLVRTLMKEGSACMMAKVAAMASYIKIIGRVVPSLTKHSYFPEDRAPQKIPIAQSVVPPPGSSFQLMMPGYLRLRTSRPYLTKQYWPSSYPAYFVTPYMVVGSMEVCCGVPTLGVVGPKTAIELAQNTLSTLNSTQRSRMVLRAPRLTSQHFCGFCSPPTDSMAAKWQTCVKPCFWNTSLSLVASVMSDFSITPSKCSGILLCPSATTLPTPWIFCNSGTSSAPTCPKGPVTSTF